MVPADTSIETVLAPIVGMYSHVWSYDATLPSDPWKLYDPANASMSDLTTIEPDKGYYIYATQDCVLTVGGAAITSDRTISLEAGWNLVGWTTIENRPSSDALSGLSSDPELVAWGYDPNDAVEPWAFYAADEPGSDLVDSWP